MTTTAPPAPQTSAALSHAFRNITSELGAQFLERREVIEAFVICMLARQHGFVLGPPGCLAGDTVININRAGNGKKITIKDLVARHTGTETRGNRQWDAEIPTMVARAEGGYIRLGQMANAWESGIKTTFTLTTETGRTIRATDEHPFMREDGTFAPLGDLVVGDLIRVNIGMSHEGRRKIQYRSRHTNFHPRQRRGHDGSRVVEHQLAFEASMNNMTLSDYLAILRTNEAHAKELQYIPAGMIVHHRDHDPRNNSINNLQLLPSQGAHALEHADEITENVLAKVGVEQIVSIVKFGEEMTYDIEVVDAPHNFIANGFVVHNTAKSDMLRSLCDRVQGAEFWQILMDRQLGKEESFGPIDIPQYEKHGHWVRNITGTFATAHIAFIDEVGKAGPASLNPYLTIMNERMFKANGSFKRVPLISAFGASNELLEPELAAMWDRFLVRLNVDYLQEPGNFASLLASAVTPRGPAVVTTVTLAELEDVIENHVPLVTLPPGIIDSILQLRVDLRSETITPSDRRWKQSVRLLQASAWLNGRSAVDDDDLAILRHVLWDVVEELPTVEKKVLSLTSPMTKAALDLASMLEDIDANISSRKGQSVEVRAQYGGEAQHKVGQITKKLNDQIEKANQAGRSTAKLDQVRDQLKAVKVRIFVDCMNVPVDRAQAMGA